jgi:hypothetical protein
LACFSFLLLYAYILLKEFFVVQKILLKQTAPDKNPGRI